MTRGDAASPPADASPLRRSRAEQPGGDDPPRAGERGGGEQGQAGAASGAVLPPAAKARGG